MRWRIALACLGCAIVPLFAFATYTYIRASSTLQEEQARRFAEREVAVGRALNDLTSAELQAIAAYAEWGRFATAVRKGDNQWMRRQLETLAAGSAGTAQVFAGNGGVLIASGRALDATTLWKKPEVQDLVHGVIVDTAAAGFETIAGRLVIVSAEHITSPGNPEEPAGLLVVVRPVGGQALQDVGRANDVRVQPVPPGSADGLRRAAVQTSSGVLNQVGSPFDEGSDRSVYLAVFDVDGYRSGVVKMSMDQTAVQSATSDLRTMAFVSLVLALLATLVAALLLSRYISRPLQRLATAAVAIAGGETRQTIEVRGEDEIAKLAGAFNAMSERVTDRVSELSGLLGGLTAELSGLNVVFGTTLLDAVDLDAELGHMLPEVARLVRADEACLLLGEEGGLKVAAAGRSPTAATPANPELVTSPAGVSDVANDLAVRALAEGTPLQGEAAQSRPILAASLRPGDSRGALVFSREGAPFDAEETALASMLARQVAAAVGNADAWRHLEASYMATMDTLAGALSVKDDYTEAHPKAVASVCALLSDRLALSGRHRLLLRYAAAMHDIGKIAVPERILRKPGPLTPEESSIVEGHSLIGEHIVSEIDYLRPVGPVIRAVHERWDGRGYPDGISGDAIPLEARVLLAADAYVAMTSDRPYREALSHDAALKEIERCSATQFDPAVTGVLIEAGDEVRTAACGFVRCEGVVDRVLTTVLFVDLVDSTVRAAELGDKAWKAELGRFHRIVTRDLDEYRGTQMDAVGDGVFARFDGAARAVRCALAIGRHLVPLGLSVRAGCHSGEVELTNGHAEGLAVHIGARVAAVASPGEVLVSGTVRDLVTGSGLTFAERGEHELKGVPGLWRLYAAGG